MKIRIGDILLSVVIAAAALILILDFGQEEADSLSAVVLRDGEEIARVSLDELEEPTEIRIDELGIIITAEKDRIRFTESSCLDQTCVHTGWLTRTGDTAVCLPNRVIVKLVGNNLSDIDIIAE